MRSQGQRQVGKAYLPSVLVSRKPKELGLSIGRSCWLFQMLDSGKGMDPWVFMERPEVD